MVFNGYRGVRCAFNRSQPQKCLNHPAAASITDAGTPLLSKGGVPLVGQYAAL